MRGWPDVRAIPDWECRAGHCSGFIPDDEEASQLADTIDEPMEI